MNSHFPSLARELFAVYEDYIWHSVLDHIFTNACRFPASIAQDPRIARFDDSDPNHLSIAEMMSIALEHCNALEELQVAEAVDPFLVPCWVSIQEIFTPYDVNGSYVEIIRALMNNHSKVYNDAFGFIGFLYASIDNPNHKGRAGDQADILTEFQYKKGIDIDQCFDATRGLILQSMRERPADQRFLNEFRDSYQNLLLNTTEDIKELSQECRPRDPAEAVPFDENIALTLGLLNEAPALFEEYLTTAPLSF